MCKWSPIGCPRVPLSAAGEKNQTVRLLDRMTPKGPWAVPLPTPGELTNQWQAVICIEFYRPYGTFCRRKKKTSRKTIKERTQNKGVGGDRTTNKNPPSCISFYSYVHVCEYHCIYLHIFQYPICVSLFVMVYLYISVCCLVCGVAKHK